MGGRLGLSLLMLMDGSSSSGVNGWLNNVGNLLHRC